MKVTVYPATETGVRSVLAEAALADVVVKASGVGVFDDVLIAGVIANAAPDAIRIFWDVDAPATLARLRESPDCPLRRALTELDLVLVYGGGAPVVESYEELGARRCVPIHNALDPASHFLAEPDRRVACDLAFLGNRLPDREARVARFLLAPAARLSERSFIIGGAGWEGRALPRNVRAIGHVPTADHNAFNATPLAVLNIARDSMAENGFSPATRIFEAAGAGACIISDTWEGLDSFLTPGVEILAARDGADVTSHLEALTPERARRIGEAARRRVLEEHTYARRGAQVDSILKSLAVRKREEAVS